MPTSGALPHGHGPWQPLSAAQLQASLSGYEILELLGRGGMGAVYKARQKSLNRLVAIKVLPPEITDDDGRFRDRFQHEAETMAALSHPAIVAVHDFGETSDGLLYFVMEFIDGTDAAQRIAREGALVVDEAVRIALAVCDALDYAHKRGVIHRDIKPANVLIDGEGRIKVADFGLAKIMHQTLAGGLTRTNVAMGTQEFAAPEQLTPGATVDHRADIYSLGVMLYQMLTGDVPRVMFKLPSLRRPELGTRFDALICKALETEPADRFQSVEAFRQAMTEAMRGGEQHARSRPATDRSPRHTAALIASVVAVAALFACGGWLLFGRKPSHASIITAGHSPPSIIPAIKLWDTQRKMPKEKGVRWDDAAGALVLGDAENKGMLNWAQPRNRDVIFRAEIRANPDAEYAQVRVRYNWTEGPGDFYRLQLHGGMIDLSVSEHGKGRAIKAWPLPHAYGPDEWARLELRAIGDALTVSIDGQELDTVHDATLSGPGSVMIVANKNGWFRHVEYVPLDTPAAAEGTPWTAVDLRNGGWIADGDGFTTDKPIRGYNVIPGDTADAAVRMTYSLRDASGVQITARDHKTDGKRETYVAEDELGALKIGRMLPNGLVKPLVKEIYPAGLTRESEHTLEFRIAGDTLTATLNGTFSITARDDALKDGPWAMVLKKGALVRKAETQLLPAARSGTGTTIGKVIDLLPLAEVKGFRPLSDGKSLDGWLALNGSSPPDGWRVEEGAMTGKGYSAVLTREEFGDFDLRLEWRVNPQGNGGIYYRVTEHDMIDHPLKAVEFNLMDESIPAPSLKQCGAAFGVKAPSQKAAHPTGEWNTARLLVQGTKVEQWINDQLVCSYDLTDAVVRDGLEQAGVGAGFATVKKGRIALQDWMGEAFYRNVRIRELR